MARTYRTGNRDVDLALREISDKLEMIEKAQRTINLVRTDKNEHRLEMKSADGKSSARMQVDDGSPLENLTRDIDARGYKIVGLKSVEAEEVKSSKGSVFLGNDTHMFADKDKVWIQSPDNIGWIALLPRWDDVRVPANAVNVHGAIGDPDWDDANIGWLFNDTLTEQLQLVVQLPHGIDGSAGIVPHLHWEPTTTGTGDVYWQMSYRWKNNYETPAITSWTDVSVVSTAGGTAYVPQIASFGTITKTGDEPGLSSILDIKLSRVGGNGSDTYVGDALFKEFDIHVLFDSMGSREELTK